MKRAWSLFILGMAFLFFSGSAWGQAATGQVVGTVYDQQGAVIPGAHVTVTNTATGVTSAAVTNSDGYFEVLDLSIGTYNVTVEHEGFQTTVTQTKKLEINQSLKFSITMKVGSTSQTVTVEAQVSGVETENPTLGQLVNSNAVINLPLNGRNVLNLALLQPGVTAANPTVGGFSVAGGRPDSITYLLDGGLNNNLLANNVVLNPNPDAIAEFRILTSDYTAEYGRNGAGIISVVTKSGTNKIHGSAFEFVRNDAFNANTFFNNANKPKLPRDTLKRHQFGGTLGGPITIPHLVHGHDRLFFFVDYQGQRLSDGQTQSQIPTFTPLEIAGNFSQSNPDGSGSPDPNVVAFLQANPFFQSNSALAAQGIIDPTKLNAVSKNYLALNVLPTSRTGVISSQSKATNNNNELTGKVDFAITPNDKLSVTLGGFRNTAIRPFSHANVPGFPVSGGDRLYFGNTSYTRTFSANLLNEFHFTVQRQNHSQSVPAAKLPAPAALGFGITPDLPTGPPDIDFDNGLQLGFSVQGPSFLVGNTYAYTDALTWIKGRNTWKFGGGFSAYQQNMVFDFFGNGDFFFLGPLSSGGVGTGNSFADFLLGIPNNFFEAPNAPSNIRQKTTYGFFQDEWRARNNLTFTLGLRYEFSSPKLDTQGRTFSIIPGKQSTVFTNAPLGMVFPGDAGVPRGSNFPDKDNFAPRFGFAWDPWHNGKTSIRGGGGIFYDVLKAEDNFQFNGQAPFFSAGGVGVYPTVGPGQSAPVTYFTQPFLSTPNPFPSKPPSQNIDFAAAGFLPIDFGGGVFFVDPHLHTPYTYQYNLSIQHEVAKDLVAEMNYVGSDSKGLTTLVDVNPFILGTNNRVLNASATGRTTQTNAGINAFCGGAFNTCPFAIEPEFENASFASYNSLEASLTKQVGENRFFGNSFFTLAYTLGHSIDNSSGFRNRNSQVPFNNFRQFRGPSDFDARHRITFSGGWELPFVRAWASGPKRLLAGWSLYPIFSWQTGFPLDVNAGLPFDSTQTGPSGAGDGYLANAVFSPGFTKVTILDPKLPGNHYFARNTFSTNVTSAQPYGVPKGIFRGPGRTNLDLALAKTTTITENFKAEFRVEAFNVFNHAEFNNPNTNIFSSRLGRITSTADPRIVQLALRLSF